MTLIYSEKDGTSFPYLFFFFSTLNVHLFTSAFLRLCPSTQIFVFVFLLHAVDKVRGRKICSGNLTARSRINKSVTMETKHRGFLFSLLRETLYDIHAILTSYILCLCSVLRATQHFPGRNNLSALDNSEGSVQVFGQGQRPLQV